MKKFLEKQIVFTYTLKFLAYLAKRNAYSSVTQWATTQFAKFNTLLNKPKVSKDTKELAETWKELMPKDGQQYFQIKEVTPDTAYTEIHLHCPLRGSGDVNACYKLMNYDRQLMEQVGGQLVVLESQSNSEKPYCRLAIRKKDAALDDLIPAHNRI